MQDFHQLKVWEKAHALTLEVYRMTVSFPRSEEFGLRSQLRRAPASIAANIAEGCGRASPAEFGQFLNQAIGSASELEYHLLLARDLSLIADGDHLATTERAVEVKRMLSSLLSRVRPSRRVTR
jgi:four helix bundle protein